MVIRRSDLDIALRRSMARHADYIVVFGPFTAMKIDQDRSRTWGAPGLRHGRHWREGLETNAWSQGRAANPLIPAAPGVSTPIGQLSPEAAAHESIGRAKRLLASRSSERPQAPIETTPGTSDWMDACRCLRNWKLAGSRGPQAKEYGPFVSSAIFGKFDK